MVASRDAARAEWQASAAAAAAARLTVAAQTADTYITIRSLQARLDVARDQFKTQQQLVDLIALQYHKGVAAEMQLRQAEGALSQVKAAVPEFEQNLDIAMNALDVLLGLQPGSTRAELAAAAPIPAPPAVSSAGGPPGLLRRRPDIIAAERTLAASNARIGAAISEYYPKFTLGGLLGTATRASAASSAAARRKPAASSGCGGDYSTSSASMRKSRPHEARMPKSWLLTASLCFGHPRTWRTPSRHWSNSRLERRFSPKVMRR